MVSTRTLHSGVQHNVNGIVTCYVLDSLGFKPPWWQDFTYPSKLIPRSVQPPVYESQGPFTGVKLTGRAVNHPPHLVPRLKKK